MIEFIYLFLFRCLSGAQNGFGYAKNDIWRMVFGGLMVLAIGFTVWLFQPYNTLLKWFSLAWLALGLLGTWGVEDSFNKKVNILPKSVHLWELTATTGVLLAWVAAGGNLIYIFASVYPSMILHKGFINIGSNLSFFDERTDDASGKTYSIKIPWKWARNLIGKDVISVPRMSTKIRLGIAAISLLAVIINATSIGYKITFQDLVPWF